MNAFLPAKYPCPDQPSLPLQLDLGAYVPGVQTQASSSCVHEGWGFVWCIGVHIGRGSVQYLVIVLLGPDAAKPENNLKVELNLKELLSHFMDIFISKNYFREKNTLDPVYHLHEQVGDLKYWCEESL